MPTPKERPPQGDDTGAMVDANGRPVPIKRYPTRLDIKCPACRRKATVEVMLTDVAKLKCSRCGHRNPLIVGRAPMQAWARSRRAAR
jgi:Zn ribbon nucleic-acid-binding protein